MNVDDSKVSVLVGFGGTGGKILSEFAGLMAADEKWSRKTPSQVYMVLCDTDANDLGDCRKEIEEKFPEAGFRPSLTTISLADGLGSFRTAVGRAWEDAARRGDAAMKRLQEKWWCDEGEPFTAHRVPYNIDEGAGQCPMVSYFLAWWQGTQIKDQVSRLAAEINTRIPHGGDRPSMELTIVNSLAGGTGRGSWTVLALLIRRALEKEGWNPSSVGLFLDQSCFSGVMRSRPDQRFKMKVNSLTGLSEVVMWTRIADTQRPSDRPPYHLPALDAPERSELDLVREFTSETGASATPLDFAQVMFESGRSGGLGRLEDYYGVAASAIYAQLSLPQIKSQQQNGLARMGSVGSSRVSVPYVEIEQFVRDYYLENLLETASRDDPDQGLDLSRLLGVFHPLANRPGRGQSLVERVAALLAAAASRESSVESFKAALDDQDEDGAAAALGVVAGGSLTVGLDQLRSVIQKDSHGPFKPLEIGQSDPGGETGSGGAGGDIRHLGRNLLDRLQEHMRNDLARLGATRAAAARIARELEKLQELLSAERRRILGVSSETEVAGRSDGFRHTKLSNDLTEMATNYARSLWLKKFNANERAQLSEQIAGVWVDETLLDVLKEMIKHVGEAAVAVGRFGSNLDFVIKNGFEGPWRLDCKTRVAKGMDELFITRKSSHGLDRWDFRDAFDGRTATRYGRRTLRPRLVIDEFAAACESPESSMSKDLVVQAMKRSLANALCDFAVHGGDGPRVTGVQESQPGRLVVKLEEESAGTIQRLVHGDLKKISHALHVDRRFLKEHFAFDKVVEGQLKAWDEEFLRSAGSSLESLKRDFELFYGIPPEMAPSGKPMTPPLEEVIHALVLTVAKSCEPLVQIRAGYDAERRHGDLVLAALPQCFGKDAIQRLNDEHVKAGIAGNQWAYESANPYVLTVYANQSFALKDSGDDDVHFRRVRSLEYWQDADEDNIAEWLALAEDQGGASVFAKQMRNSGLGYPDPTLVKDDAFATLRWRPWYRSEEAERDAQAYRALDAILYGLYGNLGSGSSRETRELVEELIERLESKEMHEWAMPNIRWENRRMYFQRNAVEVRDDLPTANGLVKGAPERLTLTKFVTKWSGVDESTRKAINGLRAESEYFRNELTLEVGISTSHLKALHRGVEDFLVDLELEVSKASGSDKEAFESLVAGLLERHRALRP